MDRFNREILSSEINLKRQASRIIRFMIHISGWRGYLAMSRVDNVQEPVSELLAEWQKNMVFF